MMLRDLQKFEYSEELENQLNLILEEYRNGMITVQQMLKLIDIACRDHLENKDLYAQKGNYPQS